MKNILNTYCTKVEIPGSEKFFVNDLYFSALDCSTSTKVTYNNSRERYSRNSSRISRKLVLKRFLNLLRKQTRNTYFL